MVELNTTTATITMTGPSDAYFAIGFNASRMSEKPYVIYANSDGVFEQQIGLCGSGHCPGIKLDSSIQVVSTKVVDNERTVVVTRALEGRTKQYYSFDPSVQSHIPMIAAVGHMQEFMKHREKAEGELHIEAKTNLDATGVFVDAQLHSSSRQTLLRGNDYLFDESKIKKVRNQRGTVVFKIGVTLMVSLNSTTATLNISGPDKGYFAVGFNATVMSDKPYVIYVNKEGVFEQQIGLCKSGHCAGAKLDNSVQVEYDNVVDGVHIVVLTRALKGHNKQYYTFDPAVQSTIPMIAAVGHSQQFKKHKHESHGKLVLSEKEVSVLPKQQKIDHNENVKQIKFYDSIEAKHDFLATGLPSKSGSVSFKIGITLQVDLNTTTAAITLSGPEKEYFAVGFNATRMADKPYVIYVNSEGAFEQQIGLCESGHCAGAQLESSVQVVSSKVVDNVRTVVLARPLQGRTGQYYTFDPSVQSTIPMIAAVGSSETFQKHKEKTRGELVLEGLSFL